MKPYKEQNIEIQALLKKISIKTKNFAKQEANPNFGDLGSVHQNLLDIDHFLSDKYLTK